MMSDFRRNGGGGGAKKDPKNPSSFLYAGIAVGDYGSTSSAIFWILGYKISENEFVQRKMSSFQNLEIFDF